MAKSKQQILTDYWLQNYVNREFSLCTLCGNRGQIDTRGRALSHAGIDAGRINYCICPNGIAMRLTAVKESRR